MSENQLSGYYNKNSWNPEVRLRTIRVHPAIYTAYAGLHKNACILSEKIDQVLGDSEYQMIMQEAIVAGYKMPNEAQIKARNEILKFYLQSAESFKNASTVKDNFIQFPAQSAGHLHMVAHQCSVMIDDICSNIRKTEYMRLFRDLKALEAPYTGPTCLQEMMNVWKSLVQVTQAQHIYGPSPDSRLPSNWLKLIV